MNTNRVNITPNTSHTSFLCCLLICHTVQERAISYALSLPLSRARSHINSKALLSCLRPRASTMSIVKPLNSARTVSIIISNLDLFICYLLTKKPVGVNLKVRLLFHQLTIYYMVSNYYFIILICSVKNIL